MAFSRCIAAFAIAVLWTSDAALAAKPTPTPHVKRARPTIDTSTLGPQTSSSYVFHDVGHPSNPSSYPIAFNNTGQIVGSGCQVYTGMSFLYVPTNAPLQSCELEALSDADKAGNYAVVGYATYDFDGFPSTDGDVGLVVRLGSKAPAYQLYKGYASAVIGVNDHGRTLVASYYDPIGRTYAAGEEGAFAASTTDPSLALVQSDCQLGLAGCVNPIGMLSPFHSAAFTDGGLVLGTDLNHVTTVAAIGSTRSQAIVPKLPPSTYLLAIDNSGDILYGAANGLRVYSIASGTSSAIPSLPSCSYADPINITSTGSVLGVAYHCSNPKNADALFIYDAVHGTQPITQLIPRPPNLQALDILGLNDRGQLLFQANDKTTNALDWGTLDPPGFTRTASRART